jgi:hypothetical protein
VPRTVYTPCPPGVGVGVDVDEDDEDAGGDSVEEDDRQSVVSVQHPTRPPHDLPIAHERTREPMTGAACKTRRMRVSHPDVLVA